MKIPKLIRDISLNKLKRIDVGLEGNWNSSVVTIWTRNEGLIDSCRFNESDTVYKPSLELYFEDGWIGIHCYKQLSNRNVFNRDFALKIIQFVEKKIKIYQR